MIEELNEVLNTDTTVTVGVGVGGATYSDLVQGASAEIIAILTITFLSLKILFLIIIKILEIVKNLKENKKLNRRRNDKK